ncbi:pseudouridine synthase [Synechocystis sp. PCC 7509]|uniref:pseudouridine synthase n=1 Tax=Synechocystis sp. PCC 7509 TaxID=927677 RepID=UPI0002ACEAD5|nr:pseudouridine synthase [Synechocystis sp. PCC 7509]
MEERLQKILSQWGIASRRQAEALIVAGRVRCNGEVVSLGAKADLEIDKICVDGKLLQPLFRPQLIYLLLNKPKGVVSTCNDPQGRKTVIDLLPKNLQIGTGIHPVGRLDTDSTGALILTNDGELTNKLTHPRHSIPKTYQVWVKGHPPETVLQQWRQGIILAGRKTRNCSLRIIANEQNSVQTTCLEIILKEGRNRQIRRIAELLGYPVISLHRTAIGTIGLQPSIEVESVGGNPPKGLLHALLPKGCYRYLKDSEIYFLQKGEKLGEVKNLPQQIVSIASVEEPDAF